MTDRVIDIMLKASPQANRPAFTSKIRRADEWVRDRVGGRTQSGKTGVWKRSYHSKLFGMNGPGLTVLTNKGSKDMQEDMYIEYVTITMNGLAIGGGKVFIPSAKLPQLGRKTTIADFQTQSVFAEFTEKELAVLTAELEFGGEDGMLMMLEERFA